MTRQPTPSILDDVLTTDASRPATIRNASIKVDGGTQMRAQLDPATVQEYADAMAEAGWGKFPPIIAYYDGSDYWLADGFHRLSAWRSIANWSDALIPADVRSGTRRDAILHAAGANASHGLRRTNADKRRAVETLLRDDDWRHWSNREIGRRCAVDEGTVRRIRGEMERTAEIPQSDERHGADGRITNTANIGTNQPTETDEERRQRIRDNDRRMKDEINSRYASETPAARTYWAPASAPIPAGWNEADEAEYQALLPTWQQSANQFHAISELDRITLRRVAERLSVERLDNLRFSLQERLRTLWLEERRQERDASAISNQQSPISNPAPVTETLPPADAVKAATWGDRTVDVLPPATAPLPQWADEPAPPHYTARQPDDDRLQPAQRLRALYQAVIDSDDQYGELTGRFSDTLAVKRELESMIGHLDFLINAITHPEEVSE